MAARGLILAGATAALLAASPRGSPEPERLTLVEGEVHALTFPERRDVRVSRRGVIDVAPLGDHDWRLVALRPGIALLTFCAVAGCSPLLLEVIPRALPRWLCQRVGIRCDERTRVMAGRVSDPSLLEAARKHCQRKGCEVRLTLDSKARCRMDPPMVAIAATFYESDDGVREQWPAPPTGFPEGSAPAAILALAGEQEERAVRVLARPRVRSALGKETRLRVGGEFLAHPGTARAPPVWKPFGSELIVTVTAAGGPGRYRAAYQLSLSRPGVALRQNHLQGEAIIPGQREVLLAQVRSERGEDRAGASGLAQIPILGPLFRRRDDREAQHRLWVTFRVEPLDPARRELGDQSVDGGAEASHLLHQG